MKPEDRLDGAGKQTSIVLEEEDLSDEQAAKLRSARHKIYRVRDQLRTDPRPPAAGGSE